jgi:hypothetical protein
MALPLYNGFEGGTSGTAISVANSGGNSGNPFDAIQGTVPTFSNAHPMIGNLGCAYAGSGSCQWNTASVGTVQDVWGRCYLMVTATVTVATPFMRGFTPTSATAAQFIVRIPTTNKIALLVAAGTVVTSTTTLTNNTIYRIETKMHNAVSGTGTLDCRIYLGNSTTPLETMTQATGTMAATDTSINQLWIGPSAAVTANVVFQDEVTFNAVDYPGPAIRQQQPMRRFTSLQPAMVR